MAASRLKTFIAALLLGTALGVHAAEKEVSEAPIDVKADGGYEVDFRTGKTVMHNVSVSQGDVSITAKRAEATGLDFKDTRWVFSGDVRITAEQRGNMRSNSAEVEFRDNRIAKVIVIGNPAYFEQKQKQMARGHAGEIVYEVGAGSVRLMKDAWLTYGTTEMSAPLLIYDIRAEKARTEGRVRFTILPKGTSPAAPPPQ